MTGARGPDGIDGFQDRVQCRSVIWAIMGGSDKGIGAPLLLYLSNSVYWSVIGRFGFGSTPENIAPALLFYSLILFIYSFIYLKKPQHKNLSRALET